jgi:crotonobetainyl-CoA:carnitine CoA-transferase CaiB-like acyl-CoA transferase
LDGVRVVELAMWAAGPGTAAILADWGADVIKLERPGGDPYRGYSGTSSAAEGDNGAFEVVNRNKRSVCLDLHNEAGRGVATRLLAGADVFVSNLRPRALARLGLDAPTLCARHPRLVHASISGYGHRGPERDRPAYDFAAYWARSGLMASLGEPHEPPPAQRPGMGDHTTALAAAGAVAAALFARTRTGRGQALELSLLRTAMWVDGVDVQNGLLGAPPGVRRGRARARNPLFNAYRTADDRWLQLVMLESDRHWPGLCEALERPDWPRDPRFRSAADREKHAETLTRMLDARFAERSLAEWRAIFEPAGLFFGAVQTPEETLVDPQLAANDAFVPVARGDGRESRYVASPADFSDTPAAVRTPAPEAGQHTEEVLLDAGYDWDELGRLRGAGAFG